MFDGFKLNLDTSAPISCFSLAESAQDGAIAQMRSAGLRAMGPVSRLEAAAIERILGGSQLSGSFVFFKFVFSVGFSGWVGPCHKFNQLLASLSPVSFSSEDSNHGRAYSPATAQSSAFRPVLSLEPPRLKL